MSESPTYHPEKYWSEVAQSIDSRDGHNVLAGDDSPFYRHKRNRFLSLLKEVDFKGKKVMELGSGPGGNVKEIVQLDPASITGADISQNMIDIATKHVASDKATFVKINGEKLPFDDGHFDVVFSATVLQHNTDDDMMRKILGEMCRVTNDKIYLFERIESNFKGDDLCMGRPFEYYRKIVEDHGFDFKKVDYINTEVSHILCGIVRKIFNPKKRVEGQKETKVSLGIQKLIVPISSVLDKVFTAKRDVARMEFTRK